MNQVMDFLGCIFEALIFGQFFKRTLKKRIEKCTYNFILVLGLAFTTFAVNSLGNSKLNLILGILIYFLFSVILFEGDIKERIFYFVVFYTVFAGTEIICEFVLVVAGGPTYSWDNLLLVEKEVIFCLEKLLAFLFLYILTKILNVEEKGVEVKFFICSLSLPITTFGLYSVVLYTGILEHLNKMYALFLAIICIFLLFSNAVIFYVYDYIFLLNLEKQKRDLLFFKANMEKSYYDNLQMINGKQAKYMHDIANHLKTIGILAHQEKNEEIVSILSTMQIQIEDLSIKYYTENKIVNAILCEKMERAKKQHIDFSLYVDPCIDFNYIDEVDLIIIFGNILDNAIEAAYKSEGKFIDINIVTIQNKKFFMIKVDNSFDGEILQKDKKLLTLKVNKDFHGFGIENVNTAINKYDGIMEYEIDESVFSLTIVIPL